MPEEIPLPFVPIGAPVPAWSASLIRVVYPTPAQPLAVVLTCRRPVAVQVHWGEGRTTPHKEPAGRCDGCILGHTLRWSGYASAYCPRLGRFVLALLTPSAVRSCPPLDPQSGVDLRGRNLVLTRAGDYRFAAIRAELSDPPKDLTRVPPDFPIGRALERLWGLPPGSLPTMGQQ